MLVFYFYPRIQESWDLTGIRERRRRGGSMVGSFIQVEYYSKLRYFCLGGKHFLIFQCIPIDASMFRKPKGININEPRYPLNLIWFPIIHNVFPVLLFAHSSYKPWTQQRFNSIHQTLTESFLKVKFYTKPWGYLKNVFVMHVLQYLYA